MYLEILRKPKERKLSLVILVTLRRKIAGHSARVQKNRSYICAVYRLHK